MKVCLTTICIGEKYLEQYNLVFRQSQETYALRHGYDFKVITEYISEPHPKLISMNKILVSDEHYDFIVFVDADVLINPDAPPIHDAYDFGDKIGVVSQNQPDKYAKYMVQKTMQWELTAEQYYLNKSGHILDTEDVINTGVLVIQPKKHKEFLDNIFNKYSENQKWSPHGFHYEQSVIGFELQINNMAFFMDYKWNAIWLTHKIYDQISRKNPNLVEFYKKNYFTHLAGGCDINVAYTEISRDLQDIYPRS